jgi:hypothetical protein
MMARIRKQFNLRLAQAIRIVEVIGTQLAAGRFAQRLRDLCALLKKYLPVPNGETITRTKLW